MRFWSSVPIGKNELPLHVCQGMVDMEFKPSDFYVRPHNIALEGIYGLITPDSKCYAITIVRDKDKRFVAGVRECSPILPDHAGVRGPSDVLSAPLGFPGNFP